MKIFWIWAWGIIYWLLSVSSIEAAPRKVTQFSCAWNLVHAGNKEKTIFTPDGHYLIKTNFSYPQTVSLYEISTENETYELRAQIKPNLNVHVQYIAANFLSDGRFLLEREYQSPKEKQIKTELFIYTLPNLQVEHHLTMYKELLSSGISKYLISHDRYPGHCCPVRLEL